ncbi:MAG: hypothetical protein M0R06_21365 [Sphaerochaeta sp.]|jgi:plasmid stability protein|nr:hypothetical protein [Sphaerochaeta sp.]
MADLFIRKMDRELRQALKVQAAREGRTMTEIIIELIKLYLIQKEEERRSER